MALTFELGITLALVAFVYAYLAIEFYKMQQHWPLVVLFLMSSQVILFLDFALSYLSSEVAEITGVLSSFYIGSLYLLLAFFLYIIVYCTRLALGFLISSQETKNAEALTKDEVKDEVIR